MRKLLRRIHYLMNRARLERELEDEMAAHREMLAQDRRRAFGSALHLREESRDPWGFDWLDHLRQDLAYGARTLRRSPGFTLTAILVLALGIGVNLAEVEIFAGVVAPLRVREPHMVRHLVRTGKDGGVYGFPTPAVDYYRRYSNVLSAVLIETRGYAVHFADQPKDLRTLFVTGNYFSTLGLPPAFGRALTEQDDQPGAPPVVMVSYGFWQERLGGVSSAIDRMIRLNGKPVQVVGVAPYDFTGLATGGSPIWLPMSAWPYLIEGSRQNESWETGNNVYARLKSDVPVEAVEAQLTALTGQLRRQQPGQFHENERIRALPIDSATVGPRERLALITWILLVLLVLLSACANLGNMLLARGLARRREIEIRLAVGATRFRMLRQLMTENLLLAAIASLVALLASRLFGRFAIYMIDPPPGFHPAADWRPLLAAAACALISVFAFGLAPAIQMVRTGPQTTRARKILVAVQVAVSCLLLILGSALARGVMRHFAPDLSFDYKRLIVVDPELYAHHLTAPVARQTLRDMSIRLQRLPGVGGVALAIFPPLGGRAMVRRPAGSRRQLFLNAVSPEFFPTMQLPLIAGRNFASRDLDSIIVSESAARSLWPAESPLGKHCELGRTRTVIGVVKDSGANMIDFADTAEAWLPIDDAPASDGVLVIRATGDPNAMLATINSATSSPGFVTTTDSVEHDFERRTVQAGAIGAVVGLLGGVATLLAAIGIFGLVAFTVAQRTREVGIRMALGARRPDILRSVIGQYFVPVGVGALAGLAIAAIIGRILRNQIFGLTLSDPFAYAAGLLLFIAIALGASLLPARRALSVDPSTALRYE